MILQFIPEKFITPAISAAAILTGSVIGGIWSWITTKKNIEVENRIVEDNRKYENLDKINKICDNINIIRLDICNAMFQCIRTLKYTGDEKSKNRYPVPINKDYSRVIASITGKFDLKEMSYIYQLYGIMERLNKHMRELNYNEEEYDVIIKDCELFLQKLYGENYNKIFQLDIDVVTYEELYSNDFMKIGYRKVLEKLDLNSCVEGYQQSK